MFTKAKTSAIFGLIVLFHFHRLGTWILAFICLAVFFPFHTGTELRLDQVSIKGRGYDELTRSRDPGAGIPTPVPPSPDMRTPPLTWTPTTIHSTIYSTPREDRGCSGCSPLGFGKPPIRNSEVLTGTFSENCVPNSFFAFFLPAHQN